jgi:hypothetical protein
MPRSRTSTPSYQGDDLERIPRLQPTRAKFPAGNHLEIPLDGHLLDAKFKTLEKIKQRRFFGNIHRFTIDGDFHGVSSSM